MRREPSLHNTFGPFRRSRDTLQLFTAEGPQQRARATPAIACASYPRSMVGRVMRACILICKYLPELGRSARRARGNGPARAFGRTQRYEGNSRPEAGFAFHFAGLRKSNRSRTGSRSVPAIRSNTSNVRQNPHNAIYRTYAKRDHLTGDVGGNFSTSEFTDAVIRHL